MHESIFKSIKGISWYDRDGIMKLDDKRYVRFILDDITTRDIFKGYWVEIHDRNHGLISKKFFNFQYHMEFIHQRDKYFHIWFYQGSLDWYISRPKDSKQYVKVLMDYIANIK